MSIKQQIKRLVRNECACYGPSTSGVEYKENIAIPITIKDYCDREHDKDCRCLIFKDKRCGYFERAVLPMNPKLEALYKAEHIAKKVGYKLTEKERESILEKESSTKGKVNMHCKRCGRTFEADNYRQQYCKQCRKYLNRERKREWISRKRESSANVDNQLSETVDL